MQTPAVIEYARESGKGRSSGHGAKLCIYARLMLILALDLAALMRAERQGSRVEIVVGKQLLKG